MTLLSLYSAPMKRIRIRKWNNQPDKIPKLRSQELCYDECSSLVAGGQVEGGLILMHVAPPLVHLVLICNKGEYIYACDIWLVELGLLFGFDE
jgi:hypothetical protein